MGLAEDGLGISVYVTFSLPLSFLPVLGSQQQLSWEEAASGWVPHRPRAGPSAIEIHHFFHRDLGGRDSFGRQENTWGGGRRREAPVTCRLAVAMGQLRVQLGLWNARPLSRLEKAKRRSCSSHPTRCWLPSRARDQRRGRSFQYLMYLELQAHKYWRGGWP